MDRPHPAPDLLCDSDVLACLRVLRAVEADRSHLTRLTQAQRRELLTLAGLIAKPERHDLVKMAKAFRRAEREAAKQHDRRVIDQTGLRMQRRATVYAPLWLEAPPPALARARTAQRARLLRLQEALCQTASLLRLSVRDLRRLQLCQARTERRSRRPLCAGHRRAGENRLSGIAQTAARRRACHRHHALSRRCRRPVLERAGFCGLSRTPANPRSRPASHAERRTLHAVSERAPAAARLHSEQRLPDRAAAGGFLPAPAGRRGRAARRAARGLGWPARRSSRVAASPAGAAVSWRPIAGSKRWAAGTGRWATGTQRRVAGRAPTR